MPNEHSAGQRGVAVLQRCRRHHTSSEGFSCFERPQLVRVLKFALASVTPTLAGTTIHFGGNMPDLFPPPNSSEQKFLGRFIRSIYPCTKSRKAYLRSSRPVSSARPVLALFSLRNNSSRASCYSRNVCVYRSSVFVRTYDDTSRYRPSPSPLLFGLVVLGCLA